MAMASRRAVLAEARDSNLRRFTMATARDFQLRGHPSRNNTESN